MDRSVTSEELSAWLRSVLERGSFDVSSISSHSLKHTTLSGAAKWGMDKYIRTLLGHHSTGGKSLDVKLLRMRRQQAQKKRAATQLLLPLVTARVRGLRTRSPREHNTLGSRVV